MVLDIYCACGKLNVANEEMAGQTIHCIRCGRAIQIPVPKPRPEPAVDVVPDIPATRPGSDAPEAKESVRDYLYWVLILCLVPLAFGLGQVDGKTFEQRLTETTLTLPPDRQKAVHQTWELIQEGEVGLDALFAQLPEQRLVGAWLARHSQLHWAFVLVTTLVFWGLVCFCFSSNESKPLQLLGVGLFTATFGITLLYVLHFFAPTAIFLQMAEAADATHTPDFFGSLAYYTLAVGLFEEAVKLVPVGYFLYKARRLEWRHACLAGLASGAGFGIAEGVLYSTSFYHGISTPQNYLERFASCVTLHAVWSASAGVSLYHCQDIVREIFRWDEEDVRASLAAVKDAPFYMAESGREIDYAGLALAGLRVLAVVMFLHGLYDAALVRNYYWLALGAAVISFGWLAWQIEEARRKEAEALQTAT